MLLSLRLFIDMKAVSHESLSHIFHIASNNTADMVPNLGSSWASTPVVWLLLTSRLVVDPHPLATSLAIGLKVIAFAIKTAVLLDEQAFDDLHAVVRE